MTLFFHSTHFKVLQLYYGKKLQQIVAISLVDTNVSANEMAMISESQAWLRNLKSMLISWLYMYVVSSHGIIIFHGEGKLTFKTNYVKYNCLRLFNLRFVKNQRNSKIRLLVKYKGITVLCSSSALSYCIYPDTRALSTCILNQDS